MFFYSKENALRILQNKLYLCLKCSDASGVDLEFSLASSNWTWNKLIMAYSNNLEN